MPSSEASPGQPLTSKGKAIQDEQGDGAQMLHKDEPHLFHRGRGPPACCLSRQMGKLL